jgi:DHA2 family multidrug resistance protein
MAFFFIPLVTITLSGIELGRIPAESGLSKFVRITAGAFGTSIAATVWQDRAAIHHAQLSEHVNPGSLAASSVLSGLANAGLTPSHMLETINRLVDQQAYMLAANDGLYASAIIFLCLTPLVFLAKNIWSSAGGADAAAGAR